MPDGLMIALGVKKPKPGLPSPIGGSKQSTPPPAASPEVEPQQNGMGGKASPDDAGLVDADNRCGDCMNWSYADNSCSKVEGMMSACSGCRKYFEPKSTSESDGMSPEPDADDTGTIGMNPQ